jgi:hypothetical protein
LEPRVLMVHHTSPGISRSSYRPTSRNNRSDDQLDIYIIRSSDRQACRSESQPAIEDIRSVDRLAKKLTMSWTHVRSGQASLLSQLDSVDLTESNITINDCMSTRSS